MNENLKDEVRKGFERIPTVFAVTGTFHGSLIEADHEGEARRKFHRNYKGESILCVKDRGYRALIFA